MRNQSQVCFAMHGSDLLVFWRSTDATIVCLFDGCWIWHEVGGPGEACLGEKPFGVDKGPGFAAQTIGCTLTVATWLKFHQAGGIWLQKKIWTITKMRLIENIKPDPYTTVPQVTHVRLCGNAQPFIFEGLGLKKTKWNLFIIVCVHFESLNTFHSNMGISINLGTPKLLVFNGKPY